MRRQNRAEKTPNRIKRCQ